MPSTLHEHLRRLWLRPTVLSVRSALRRTNKDLIRSKFIANLRRKIFPARKNRRKSRTIVYLLLRQRDNVQYVEGHNSDTRILSFVRENVHAVIKERRCKKRYPLRTFPILLCVVLKLGLDRFFWYPFQIRFIHYPHNPRYIVPSQRHRHYVTNKQKSSNNLENPVAQNTTPRCDKRTSGIIS